MCNCLNVKWQYTYRMILELFWINSMDLNSTTHHYWDTSPVARSSDQSYDYHGWFHSSPHTCQLLSIHYTMYTPQDIDTLSVSADQILGNIQSIYAYSQGQGSVLHCRTWTCTCKDLHKFAFSRWKRRYRYTRRTFAAIHVSGQYTSNIHYNFLD